MGKVYLQVIERSFVNPKLILDTELEIARKINYSFIDESSSACAVTLTNTNTLPLGHQKVSFNIFNDGSIGFSVQDHIPQFLLCSYKREKENNPDLFLYSRWK